MNQKTAFWLVNACVALLFVFALNACGLEDSAGRMPPFPVKDAGTSAAPQQPGNGVPEGSSVENETPAPVTDPDTSEEPTPAPVVDAGSPTPAVDAGTPPPSTPTMSFFVSSVGMGKGGDLRATAADTDGLAGADAHCKKLAAAVSAQLGAKTWRAYLSTSTVNARDRIGQGPWRNQKGVVVAQSVAALHEEGGLTNALNYQNSLDEKGEVVPGVTRPANTTNVHDVLTGSTADGRVAGNLHCNNWTSSTAGQAQVGHSDRTGGGSTSWNAVHTSGGCAETGNTSVRTGGGRGSLYCFAIDGN